MPISVHGAVTSFTETFAAGLASYGDRPCIEFEGRWYSGNDITAYADAIANVLRDGRRRRRRPGRAGGPQPAAACRRDHRLPRRGSPRLDDLLLPVARIDRPRHREAGVVGHRRRSRGLDGTGDRGRQACRQCGRGDLVDGAYRRGRRRTGASRRIPSACRGRTRCGTSDSDQRHHRPAEAAGDQDTRAGANGVQRDQRGEGPAGCATGVRLLAVRRHRGVPADRGRPQRQADRHARAVHRRRVRERDKDAPASRARVCSPPSSACCSTPTCPRKTWRRWIS